MQSQKPCLINDESQNVKTIKEWMCGKGGITYYTCIYVIIRNLLKNYILQFSDLALYKKYIR